MEPEERKGWERFLGKGVIVDTRTPLIYMGTLRGVDDHFLVVETVDVHDRGEGHSTQEKYALEARKFGIKANRRNVTIRKEMVVSLSLLDDVIPY